MNNSSMSRTFFTSIFILLAMLVCTPHSVLAADLNIKLVTDKKIYQRGQAIKVTAYVTYPDGKPVIATVKRELSLKDSAGVTVAQKSLTALGNGYYSAGYLIPPTARTGTWKAKASVKDNAGAGGDKSVEFSVTAATADTTPPVTTPSPAGGSFAAPVNVVLAANETATIYYTTNGSTPTTASTVYTAPLAINATTILKFFARDMAGNSETVKSASYTIITDTTPPVTSASPAGGTFTAPVSVTLSANEAAIIYYTTDSTTPSTVSTVYTAPIAITSTTTLRFFARDTAGNSEVVKAASFNITVAPPPAGAPHAGLKWNGAGTCLPCHSKQANAVHSSVHYQWKGASPDIVNHSGTGGKDGGAVNAYCINILGNWNGCSACHVGRGAKPTAVADQAQLENIDCLLCHQENYKRVKVNGMFEPDTAAMTVTMDQAVQTLHKPTRATCLQCHAKAGGGDAVKRGDITMAHAATTDRNFDVHMATTGANLACQACHIANDHQIPGRGSDLRPTEGNMEVSCSTSQCHSTKTSPTGHVTAAINKHTSRLACQTCHIKSYARNAADTVASEATETFRTWQQNTFVAAKNQYHPLSTLANDLKPEYFFWNGTSWGYNLNDQAVIDPATGFYKVSRPLGSIGDATSKLYPFKYKTAEQPMATSFNKLIALDTSVFFATGNAYNAIQAGLVNMGLTAGEPYAMVITDEYQTLNHEVTPKTQALTCNNCHGSTAQMDLKGKLGYALKGPQSTVCVQCHELKSNPGFTSLHSKHVDSKRYDCSFCHTFSRPERGLRTTR